MGHSLIDVSHILISEEVKHLERSKKCMKNCKGIDGVPLTICTIANKITILNSRQ
jgi:hypothetical protein